MDEGEEQIVETTNFPLSWKDVDIQRGLHNVASRRRLYASYRRIVTDMKTLFHCQRCRSPCTPREWEYHGCSPKGIGICIWCGKQIWFISTAPKWFCALHQVGCARSFLQDLYEKNMLVNPGDEIDGTVESSPTNTTTFVGQLNTNDVTLQITPKSVIDGNTDSSQTTNDYSQQSLQEKGLAYFCGITCDRIQRLENIILQEFSNREKTLRQDCEERLTEMKNYYHEREQLLAQHIDGLRKYNSVLQGKIDSVYP